MFKEEKRFLKARGASLEVLIGEPESPAKRGPTPRPQHHIECIGELPKHKQRFLMDMLDTGLPQASR